MATLLVVDDDAAVVTVTAMILERVGHAVLSALGGALGIAAFELHERTIHGVLMDIAMPGVDGITAFRQIRRRRPEVPFVFVTSSPEMLPEAVKAEPRVALLIKPYRMTELVTAVDQVLAVVAEPVGWALPSARVDLALQPGFPPATARSDCDWGQ